MEIQEVNNTKFNITLVYEELSADNVSFDKIRDMFDDISLHQIPQNMLVIAFNDKPIQCQIGQRRIIANYIKQSSKENFSDIIEVIEDIINHLLELAIDKELVAYGFNIDGNISIAEDGKSSSLYFKDNFLNGWNKVEEISGGKVENFKPSFSLQFEDYEYNINFQEDNNNKQDILYHFNIHFSDNSYDQIDDLSHEVNYHSNNIIDLLRNI